MLTGGATGIGAAAVTRLLAAGSDIYVLDVAAPAAPCTQYIRCDLGDQASIDHAIAKLPARLDALVNVAGIAGPEPANVVVAVNFLGLRHLTESLVSRITAGGCIVNVASTAGRDWQKRADVVAGLLDTADFAGGMSWLHDARRRVEREPV